MEQLVGAAPGEVAGSSGARSGARRPDLLRRVLVGTIGVLMASFTLAQSAEMLHLVPSRDVAWGVDFRGGLWPAAHAMLRGRSPYPASHPALLRRMATPYVWPPLLALLLVPFVHLPLTAVLVAWNLACGTAFFGALWLLGVRRWELYVLAAVAAPLLESLYFGQPEGLFALLLAVAWRYRDHWPAPVAVGVLVAAKLLAWPLILWLAVTGRRRSAVWATAVGAALLMASWAPIGFAGLLQYPGLLSADTAAFGTGPSAMGFGGVALHLGLSVPAATLVAMAGGLATAAAMVVASGGSDEGWFSAGILGGLLTSPVLWTHYALVLFVPLAMARSRSRAPWLAMALLWVWLVSGSYGVDAAVTTAALIAAGVWATARGQVPPVSRGRRPGSGACAGARPSV